MLLIYTEKCLKLENSLKSQSFTLSLIQFNRWVDIFESIEMTITKLRREIFDAKHEESIFKSLTVVENKCVDYDEELYLLVCGVFLYKTTLKFLECEGCKLHVRSEIYHDCVMRSEFARLDPLLNDEVIKLPVKFLEIRDIFVRVAVDLLPSSLGQAISRLPVFEKTYLQEDCGKERVRDQCKFVSDVLSKVVESSALSMIETIVGKIN